MKKLIITLLAAVLASGAFAQSSFPDIPANHWAGDAVDRIADLGIVIGFPDGTFRGNEAFTRYQAALVVSRLLDVLNANVDAALAMTQADIESLRNAVQEIGSDVAAQGVRLSAAESAIAGLSDDVAGNTARLDELEGMIGSGDVDPAVLRDLQNQIASQRVAIDTAQAQADAAAARADDAYSLASQANTLGRQNAEEIAAINRVLQLLSDDITGLKGSVGQGGGEVVTAPATDLAGVNAAIERNRSDIANIREFVILLRRDQVALRDRVAALEASDAAQNEAIASLDDRVTALETNPLGISGSISVDYFVGRVIGNPFDVDRVYGLNNDRDMGASTFSSGVEDLDDDSDTNSGYETEVGEVAQDRHDITQTPGDVSATLSLSFGVGFSFDGAGSPNALNTFTTVLSIYIDEIDTLGEDSIIPLFRVEEFTTTFEPIGAVPLTFAFGTNVETSFTPYIVETDDPGFVATVGSPDFLSFLNPSLTVAYTTPTDENGPVDPITGDPTNEQNDYLRGAHLAISPLDGLTLGGTFAQYARNAGDKDDYLDNNNTLTVFGVDGSLSLSIFDLAFEWAQGSDNATPSNTDSVLYAILGIDASGLPIINSLEANYRAMGANWANYGFNLGADADDPFELDQTGFGVNAGLSLFILDVDAYFDSYSVAAGDDVTAFGVDVSADLFAGFSLSGWFHQASINGTVVDDLEDGIDGNEAVVVAGMDRNNNYDTGFGVDLTHDGAAENALISGLNIAAGYSQTEADFSKTTIYANADMDLTVSIVTLTPYVGYEMITDQDAGNDDTTTLKVGTGLVTAPLNVYTQPSLMAAVNYRNTAHSNAATYTATELQWSVGLVLNEFIFENSVLTAKYGSWTGTNITATNLNRASHPDPNDQASDISNGDQNGTGTQTTTGYEVIWNYFDLEFAYGVYENTHAGGSDSAQAFSIAYTVDF